MSSWLDISGSANNFKRSYFHGFVDVSGGNMNLRNNAPLEFYDTSDARMFSINKESIYIKDSTNAEHTFATEKLKFIKSLDSDVKTDMDSVKSKTQNLTGNATKTSSDKTIEVTGDATFVGPLTGNASTATKLQNMSTIGGVNFDGSMNIDLPGVNVAGNQDTTGNAATATKLAATVQVGGVAFDGSAAVAANDIVANSTNAALLTGAQTIGGAKTFSTIITGDLSGNAKTVTNGVYTAGDQNISGVKTFNSLPACNLAPSADSDLSNKAYVDSVAQGLDVKASVVAATTANLASFSGTVTVDGENLIAGDRLLVKNQTTPSENGIYIVSADTWSRADDFAQAANVASSFTFVEKGTVNGNIGFVVTSNNAVGGGDIDFSQFSGAGSLLVDSGIFKSGNTIGLSAGGIITAKLADDAVTTIKIANSAVNTDKLAVDAVIAGKLAADAVETAKIKDDAVTTDKILDGAVTSEKIGNGQVNNSKLSISCVEEDELAADAVVTTKIKDANVTHEKLAANAVESDNIATDAVTTLKIADVNVTAGKLAADAVTTIKIVDANVTTAKIADANVTTAKIADVNVTAGKLATDAVETAKIKDGAVIAGKLAADAVTTVKILDANVTTDKIANVNVTAGKLASNAVTTVKILDANVTTAKIADVNVTAGKLAADAVETDKIKDGAVTNAKLGQTLTVAKGGTGATDAATALSNLGAISATSTDTLSNKTLTAPKFGSAGFIGDANAAELIKFSATVANAVNEFTVSNAASGSGPSMVATGSDDNIDVTITPKGTGSVVMSKVDINAGAIDGATIATSDVTVGAGKTLNVSAGTLTTSAAQNKAIIQGAASNLDIGAFGLTAQNMDGIIGANTPAAITGTTITANTAFSGALSGNASTATKISSIDNENISLLDGAQTISAIKSFTALPNCNTDPAANNDLTRKSWVDTQITATRAYADSVAQGLDIKDSVRVATTENITLSNTQTVDTIALAAGDRVLVKNQNVQAGNGIYVVVDGGSWTRAADMDDNSDGKGNFTFVEQGSQAGTGWVASSAETDKSQGTVGTHKLSFAQFSSAGTVTGGTGITVSANEVSITAGSVSTTELADNAVTSEKIGNGQVNNSKLSISCVEEDELAADAVVTTKIKDANVTHEKLAANAVESDNIATDAVTTLKIADVNVTAGKLAADAVTTIKIVDANVTTAKIADTNVTTAKIADDAVTGAKIADGEITSAKLGESLTVAKGGTGASDAANALTNLGAQAALTFGIANTNSVKIHSGTVASGDFARFTAEGVEGRSLTELKTDLNYTAGEVGAIGATEEITLTNKTLTAPKFASAGFIADANAAELIKFSATVANAVNELTVSNAATGSGPSMIASGDDDNIDVTITPKGTGSVVMSKANITSLALNGTALTSTGAELNILDGVTSTAAELNLVDGSSAGTILNEKAVIYGASGEVNATTLQIAGNSVTSTAAELNILSGVTSTAAELNILDGVTATKDELNILDGVTSTAAELNIVDGGTSATATTVADADRVVLNDDGTMVQAAVTDLDTYFSGTTKALTNKTIASFTGGNSNAITVPTAAGTLALTSQLHDAVTLANTNYLSIDGQAITGGTVPVASGGTGSTTAPMIGVVTAADAAAARAVLSLDTGDSPTFTNVTISGTPGANNAVPKSYVDGVVQGLNLKESVRVATTENITLANTQTVDGKALAAGDRVLVKEQTASEENGIYLVVDGGNWTRVADASTAAELRSAFVFVEEGTASGDKGFVCTTETVPSSGTFTLDTDAVAFTQFSNAGTYTADGSTLSLSGTTFSVKDGGVTNDKLAGSIAVSKLDSVTATAAELNYLDITTLGTSANSKALTQSAGGVVTIGAADGDQVLDIASHDLADGGLKLAGVLVTSSAAELNLLDGVTASTSELNKLDGVTASTSELNILDGVTATAAELNILDNVTATSAELNYLDITALGTSENSKVLTQNGSGVVTIGATAGDQVLDIASHDLVDGGLKLAGALVTSSAAELNLVDGSAKGTVAAGKAVIYGDNGEVNATTLQLAGASVTSTAAELNYLDITTLGTSEASKAVTAAANGNVTIGGDGGNQVLDIASHDLVDGGLKLAGSLVTSSAAELNLVDGSSAGTVANSKAVIYGANGEVNATTLQLAGVSLTSSAAELNILTGVTSTAAELNILDGVTATKDELNILDGVTSTAAELNILDGVTATSTELNLLDGLTATTAQLNYVAGVTSAIQTQLDAKQASITAGSIANGSLANSSITIAGAATSLGGTITADAIMNAGTGISQSSADNGTTVIGASNGKVGFYGATAVVQQAHIDDAASTQAEAGDAPTQGEFNGLRTDVQNLTTKVNAILAALETLGLVANA